MRKGFDVERVKGLGGANARDGELFVAASRGESGVVDVPFELVGQITSTCAVAEAANVEGGAAAARRHVSWL